jgi:hypothetical protein
VNKESVSVPSPLAGEGYRIWNKQSPHLFLTLPLQGRVRFAIRAGTGSLLHDQALSLSITSAACMLRRMEKQT